MKKVEDITKSELEELVDFNIDYDLLDYLIARGYTLDFGYKKDAVYFDIEIHERHATYWTNNLKKLEKVIAKYTKPKVINYEE